MVRVLTVLGYFLVAVSPVYAQTKNCGDPGAPACFSDLIITIKNIIKLLAPAAGLAFFIMLLVGGFQFILSGGDAKAAAGARNTMTFALIGIILVIASWLIIALIAQITGAPVTTVTFP